MNVLHIIPGLDPADGGPSAAMVGLALAQRRAGLGVRILTCAPPGTDRRLIEQLRIGGVEVTALEDRGGILNCPPAMREALRAQVCIAEIVHIHAVWEPLQHFAASEARRQGKPYLIRPCGMLTGWSMARKKLKKRSYYRLRLARDIRGATALHYTAERERELSSPWSQGRPSIIAPNGVDTKTFANLPAAGLFRQRWEIPTGHRVILFVGRLHAVKGLDLLVRAFADGTPNDTSLVLVGSGDALYIKQLKRTAMSHGVSGRVVFTGSLYGAEKLEAYVDADLFVLPSRHENFGMVVVESLACGTPVLLSDKVAICRELEAAGLARVVALQNAGEFSKTLSEALDSAQADPSLGGKCHRFVMDRYQWGTIAQRWCEAYMQFVGTILTAER